jgi:hypothetical protein
MVSFFIRIDWQLIRLPSLVALWTKSTEEPTSRIVVRQPWAFRQARAPISCCLFALMVLVPITGFRLWFAPTILILVMNSSTATGCWIFPLNPVNRLPMRRLEIQEARPIWQLPKPMAYAFPVAMVDLAMA